MVVTAPIVSSMECANFAVPFAAKLADATSTLATENERCASCVGSGYVWITPNFARIAETVFVWTLIVDAPPLISASKGRSDKNQNEKGLAQTDDAGPAAKRKSVYSWRERVGQVCGVHGRPELADFLPTAAGPPRGAACHYHRLFGARLAHRQDGGRVPRVWVSQGHCQTVALQISARLQSVLLALFEGWRVPSVSRRLRISTALPHPRLEICAAPKVCRVQQDGVQRSSRVLPSLCRTAMFERWWGRGGVRTPAHVRAREKARTT